MRSWAAGVENIQIIIAFLIANLLMILIQASICLLFMYIIFQVPIYGDLAWILLILGLQGYCGMCYGTLYSNPRCLKITEKVSFNITSEASYVYISSGQKLIKNAKNGSFWRVFENLKLAVKQCYQTGQKLVENAKIKKTQMRHFEWTKVN